MQIKAIETQYKGYRFRSRLEARWAVFFDALGIEWEYEPEGFDLGEAGWYLPDFWIGWGTEDSYWIEIKPHRNLSQREIDVALALSEHRPGFVMCGTPKVPVAKRYGFRATAHEGAWAYSFAKIIGGSATLEMRWEMANHRLYCWHERQDRSLVLWPYPAYEPILVKDIEGYCERLVNGWMTVEDMLESDPIIAGVKSITSKRLIAAYTAARSARFEHGETP